MLLVLVCAQLPASEEVLLASLQQGVQQALLLCRGPGGQICHSGGQGHWGGLMECEEKTGKCGKGDVKNDESSSL
jgi:hypothetical protein